MLHNSFKRETIIKKEIIFLSSCFLLFFFSGCYYNKADQVYPKPGTSSCDTSNVRLSIELNQIMEDNCFRCHGGAADLGAGIQLQDYNVLVSYANNGLLFSAIEHDGNAAPMPQDGGKLSDCEISQFKAWFNAGAANN